MGIGESVSRQILTVKITSHGLEHAFQGRMRKLSNSEK